MQIMHQIAKVNFFWGPGLKFLLKIFEVLANIPQQVIAPDCLLQFLIGFGDDANNSKRLIYWRAIANGIMPIVFTTVIVIFWVTVSIMKGQMNNNVKDKILATLTVVMFIYYPTMFEAYFELINCKKIASSLSLFSDLHETCFSQNHLLVLFLVAVPCIVCWLYVTPFIVLRSMFRSNKKIEQ